MDNFRYTMAILGSVETCKGELSYIEFVTKQGLRSHVTTDPFLCAEYKVDYYNARKAVGHNLRLMRDWLNKEGLYERV